MEKTFYFKLMSLDSKKVIIDDLLQVNETIINPIGGNNIEKGMICLSCLNCDSNLIPNYSKKLLILYAEDTLSDGDCAYISENDNEYEYLIFDIVAQDIKKHALKVYATYPKILGFPSISKEYIKNWCKSPVFETNKISIQEVGGLNVERKIIPLFNDKEEILFSDN